MRSYRKNILRTFRSTLSRFFAIFFIVALGVGFLAGLLSTTPDIEDSMENYLDGADLYDFRVVSTLGLTEEDVAAVQALAGVETVQPGYSADLLVTVGDGDTAVARAHSLPTEADGSVNGKSAINQLTVVEGRLPAAPGECVVEAGGSIQGKALKVGDTFRAAVDNTDLDEKLGVTEFTVVGRVRSAYYFSYEREPASVGNGSVGVVFYLQTSDFSYSAYTELFATVKGAGALPSLGDDYKDLVAKATDSAKEIEDARCEARYNGIRSDAQTEIDDAWKEYNDAKAEADEKLADAAQKLADGKTAIADAKQELADGETQVTDGQSELDTNTKKVADGQAALDSALEKLQAGQAEYQSGLDTLASGEQQLYEAKLKLDEGWQQYNSGYAQYQQNLDTVVAGEQQLGSAKEQLNAGQAAYDQGAAKLEASRAEIATAETAYAGLAQLNEGQKSYDAGVQAIVGGHAAQGITITAAQAEATFSDEALAGMIASTPESALTPQYQQLAALNAAQKRLAAGRQKIVEQQAAQGNTITAEQARAFYSDQALAETRAKLDAGSAALSAGEQQLAESKTKLDAGWAEYNASAAQLADARTQLDGAARQLAGAKAQLEDGQRQYDENADKLYAGKAELKKAKETLDEGFATLNDKQSELADAQKKITDARAKLADARQSLADGRATLDEKAQELADGELEYADAKKEADDKLAEGKAKIEDAESQLNDLEKPSWYVWSREDNVSFHSFRGNVTKVEAIAHVFPFFFFLVAALVVSTTMTRMVEEERLQIGTMKALGYGERTIMQKYLWYALAAALSGTAFGLSLGFTVFPSVIWQAYEMMYYMPRFTAVWRWNYALLAGGSLTGCALLVTWLASRTTLRESPADLMRPRAPKAGKRILLEYITPLWKRLPFSRKVTCRNLFRYKKRFWMTVIGVSGCTALLVTGFGISDSLNSIVTLQYGNVSKYSLMTTVRDPADVTSGPVYDALFATEGLQSVAATAEKVTGTMADGSTADIYLMVPQQTEELSKYIDLHERLSRTPTPLGETGVVLTEKLAESLKVKAGDTVTLQNADQATNKFTVTGVCENYISNYAYLSAAAYQSGFGEAPEPNTVLSLLSDTSAAAQDALSAKLLALDDVSSVTFSSDMVKTVLNMLHSINSVVVMIVVCAAGLAFVVLYNLTNINIAERVKEIATIKVLGFYDREVNAYVMRESVALSLIGAVLGLGLGVWLHRFIVVTVEVEAMMFGRDIEPLSFVYAFALTMLFSALVNLVMGRRLKKISMVESMKAPE